MTKRPAEQLARDLLQADYDQLGRHGQHVLSHLASGEAISRPLHQEMDEARTVGERLADAVASFGGSWRFIIAFFVVLATWVSSNAWLLGAQPFDPYPFVFLNLVLSMLAAIQAPIIMMSQNRQANKDRQIAAHDYEVNLKAELEIMQLHSKLDELRHQQIDELIKLQREQMALLQRLVREEKPS